MAIAHTSVTPKDGKKGQEQAKVPALVMDLIGKQMLAKNSRSAAEAAWQRALMGFRGQDTSTFRASEKSKVSLRTTKVKTRAAVSQINEALFSNGKFPLSVSETKVPLGVYEFAHIHEGGEMQSPEAQGGPEVPQQGSIGSSFGYEGDGQELIPGANLNMLGGMFKDIPEEMVEGKLMEGVGLNGEPTISPAKEAAKNMERKVLDDLEAARAVKALKGTVSEMCILGTGALKGPFNVNKEIPKWITQPDGSRKYQPVTVTIPKVDFVSLWDLYIDPVATSIQEAEWVIERHKMNFIDLRSLAKRPLFDRKAIVRVLEKGPSYNPSSTDTVREDPKVQGANARATNLYEVMEFWGYMDRDKLKEFGLRVPPELTDDYLQVNIWYSGDEILRISLNPFQPMRIPYYVCPYEEDPYSIYGTGVPASMEDQQKMINGFMRMAVDNLALAGNMVFDIDESMLVPGQSMEIEPGKIFRRVSGQPGTAIHSVKFQSTANENLQMVREMRQQADEATGIPSIAHGQTGVSGTGRTASGMSMILNNASLNIKDVVGNIDKYIVEPLGQAMFAWEMQFHGADHPEIEGDLEIKATGASSLEQKDVESQRLQTFLQLSMNPALAPLIKLPNIVKRLAQTMDMQPEDILNSPEEAALYAQIMGQQNMQQPMGGTPGAQGNPLEGQGSTGNFESMGNPEGINGSVEGVNAPMAGM